MSKKINFPYIKEEFQGKKLKRMRLINRLTEVELALKLDVSQPYISDIEKGKKIPNVEIIEKIAKFFKMKTKYFFIPINKESKTLLFRKKSNLKTMDKEFIEEYIRQMADDINNLLNDQYFDIKIDYSYLKEAKTMSPENVARYLKKHWGITKSYIDNITNLLEKKGIFLVYLNKDILKDYDKFDGITTKKGNIYVIGINKNMPIDRIRFTIAHELGHIVLGHDDLDNKELKEAFKDIKNEKEKIKIIEKQANNFASEFLIDTHEFIKLLSKDKISLSDLITLKRHFKVSIQALLLKAKNLDIITENKYISFQIILHNKGWKREEPKLQHTEEPFLINYIKKHYYDNLKFSKEDISNLINYEEDNIPNWLNKYETLKFPISN